MPLLIRTALLLLFCVLPLIGCAGSPPPPMLVTRDKIVPPPVPAELLSCMSAPEVPAATMQSQVADYLVDAANAGADCREKLKAVAGLLKEPPLKPPP